MSLPDVSVVIVTYNSARHIGVCLDSLRAHVTGVSFEAVVVDNASADGTASIVRAQHPWARLIERRVNGGLSAGVNSGVAASSGRHVIALNPDTRVAEDVLAPLAAYLDAHADAGIVAPKLLDDDGALQLSCRAFPGYRTAFFGRYALLTKLLPGNRYSRDYLMTDFDHASERDVDWVSGAAMMFPRSVFESLGGWDAGFFMFNEDVDFCRRAHDAGLRVVYYPYVSVTHEIGVSKRAPPRIVVARHRSMWRYYRKHLKGNPALDAFTAAGIAGRCGLMLAALAARTAIERVRSAS
jgi:GT2 family glycosyltransferase